MIKSTVALIFFVIALIATSFVVTPVNDIREKITVDGFKREYIVHLPKGYESLDNIPLLIALHGRFGTGKQLMETSSFNKIADREGFIVVYPDGYRRSWADGRGRNPAEKKGVDDVKFIKVLIDEIITKYLIDKNKIFVTGHSNGGFMTQRLAVELTDKIAGVASVAASLSEYMSNNFEPSGVIPVLFINGTEDTFVKYEGGRIKGDGFSIAIEEAVNKWLENNECSEDSSIKEIDKYDDDTKIIISTYESCSDSTMVKLIKIVGGGHPWPGGDSPLPKWVVGRNTEEIKASEEIWKFFKNSIN
jgi:polyhydroxybutyrate depolymerase